MIEKLKFADLALWRTCWRGGLLVLGLVLLLGGGSNPAQAACATPAGMAGDIIYNASNKVFQYCNDTTWKAMNIPGTGSGGCITPTIDEGHLTYNSDYRTLQGCAGSAQRSIGSSQNNVQTSGWIEISVGGSHSCGIKSDGTLWCWGSNSNGATGMNTSTGTLSTPTLVNGRRMEDGFGR